MISLSLYSICHPKRVVLAAALVVLAAAPGLWLLKLRTDGHALIPADAQEILTDRAIRDAFLNEDPVVVVVRTNEPNGIYNVSTLRLVEQLTDRLGELDGVRPCDLFSLATEHGHRVWPGTLNVRRLLEPMPQSPDELDRLRQDVRAIGLYTGTLISRDESAAAIMVGVPRSADRPAFFRSVQLASSQMQTNGETISIIGAPVAEVLLGTHLLEDLGVPNAWLGRYAHAAREQSVSQSPTTTRGRLVAAGRMVGLVPIALAVMAAVFLVSFRSVTAAILPLTEVGACLLFIFGAMGYVGVPFYLTFAVLPVILTAIGVADEIHIFSRYVELRGADVAADHDHLLRRVMQDMAAPVTKTSLTTAVAFLSFALSPLEPVRMFGLFTAAGIVFCWIWSIAVIPASLVLLGSSRLKVARPRVDHREGGRLARSFAAMCGLVVRRRVLIMLIAGSVVALTPFGIKKLLIQDSWINGFSSDSSFRRATLDFNRDFLGMHVLNICVDAGAEVLAGTVPAASVEHHNVILPASLAAKPADLVGRRLQLHRVGAKKSATTPVDARRATRGWDAWIETAQSVGAGISIASVRQKGSPRIALRLEPEDIVSFRISKQAMMNPAVLALIAKLDDFIAARSQDAVGGVLSTADFVSTANFMARGLKVEHRVIPAAPEKINWVWSQYKRIRGDQRLRQIVDKDFSRGLVTVYLKDANFVATQRLMDAIRGFEAEHLSPKGISLEFAGDVAVSQTLINSIVSTQIRSVGLSLVAILLMTAFLWRSMRYAVLCVLPCCLAVLVNFAFMGYVGMPLGVATSMFAGMTLGIGVDYAIHLLERFRLLQFEGLDTATAIVEAVRVTGPAVLIDAIAVALGFGVLTFSQVPANARLGMLLVLSILGCLLATVVVLPSLVGAKRESPPAEQGAE